MAARWTKISSCLCSIFHVKPFQGSGYIFKYLITQLDKAVVEFLELHLGLSFTSEGVAGSALDALDDIDERACPALLQLILWLLSPGRARRQEQAPLLAVLQPDFTGPPEGGEFLLRLY